MKLQMSLRDRQKERLTIRMSQDFERCSELCISSDNMINGNVTSL